MKWLSLLKVRASYGEVALDDFEVGNYRYMYEDYIKKMVMSVCWAILTSNPRSTRSRITASIWGFGTS